ncbi:MAG TPA: YicC family protein [Candidatus Hydrogenedentes bacterium]|nr:YicC family protein [Candidatus Hydrogenedentota bacterium]
MTGFGKAARVLDGETITVELSAVNHRFLDCAIHLPPPWLSLEADVKAAVRDRITRGRLNIWIGRRREGSFDRPIRFNAAVARQYVEAAHELGAMLGAPGTLSLDVLAQLDGVFYPEDRDEDQERLKAVLLDALNEALDALNDRRTKEGEALASDVRLRVDAMLEALAAIEARLPELEQVHIERLRARMAELNVQAQLAEERMAIELALLAEKGDVTEESVRLKTHLAHALDLVASDGPVGRELNFLIQEIQRETNTLGSKVRDTEVSREVIRIKSELEKFREQAQNIE